MPILILSILLQLALIVHVLKTGRNTIWVFILLFAPVIGGLAYLIVELLPEFTGSRAGRRLRNSVTRAVNPDRDLKEAARNLAVAGTAQNAMTLAGEYLAKGRFAEARDLYAGALRGVHADDPELLLGLARAVRAGRVPRSDRLAREAPAEPSGTQVARGSPAVCARSRNWVLRKRPSTSTRH